MVRVVRGICIALAVIGLASGCTFDTTGPSTLATAPNADATSIGFLDSAVDTSVVDLTPKDGASEDSSNDLIADARSADTSRDTLATDVSVDTLSRDVTVDTLVRPDGWVSDAAVSICSALYGTATNYELCSANATSCSFAFDRGDNLTRLSCNTLCGETRCLGAHDNESGTTCTAEPEPGCTAYDMPSVCSCRTIFRNGICICSQ